VITKIKQVIVMEFGRSADLLANSSLAFILGGLVPIVVCVSGGMPIKATSWPSGFGRVCRLRLHPGRVSSGGYAD